MKYFVEPPLGAKLSYAYDRWIRKPEERGRIDSLLRAFSKVRKDEAKMPSVKDVNVVSWRGVMTRYFYVFF
jgi:RAT1-interacting protein